MNKRQLQIYSVTITLSNKTAYRIQGDLVETLWNRTDGVSVLKGQMSLGQFVKTIEKAKAAAADAAGDE